MKKIYSILGLLAFILLAMPVSAQITVYTDAFTGSGGPIIIPGGSPALTYTNDAGNSNGTATAGSYIGGSFGSVTFTNNMLSLFVSAPTSAGTNNGYAQSTAPITGFSAPFNAILSSNVGLVSWTFNMKTSIATTGLAANQNAAAVVLAASNPAIRTLGNGYAVTYDPDVAGGSGIKLIKYSGGLTGTTTTLVSAATFLASPLNYTSIRVTYQPLTNVWILYIRDDGNTAFLDPFFGVIIPAGSVIDGTYTGTAATSFGFYSNYSVAFSSLGPNVQYGTFDNFTVTVTCPEITGVPNTCVGMTTTLGNLYAGGTWVSGTTAVATIGLSSGIVTGIAPGTSVVTYTSGLCAVTIVVTVNPLPAPSAIIGPSTVCGGQSIVLADLTSPGTWSSGNTAIATVVSTGVVTGVDSGVVNISYTVPTGCFAVKTITVNPLPPISGSVLLCQEQTATFTNTVTGGTWFSTNTATATIDGTSGAVVAVSPGNSTISYTTPAGCITSVIVTVNPLPNVATGTPTVCQGFTTTLTSTSPGLDWSSSAALVASVPSGSGVVTGNSAGTAIITYKLPTSCLRTVIVTVNPAATITMVTSSVCVNATITLNGTPTGGTWTSTTAGVTADIGLSTGIVTGIAAGTSVISYILPTGCFRLATITVNPLPTPITGTLTVCPGLTTALGSGPAGGTWSSSTVAVGTVSTTGVVTGLTSNTTVITYTIGTGTGCYQTAIVTVSPAPSPITGTALICGGTTTTLANGSAGVGTWSSGTPAVATVGLSTGIVTALTAGTSVITYTAATGCIATRIVTVQAQPATFTGSLSVCEGLTTTLSSTPGVTWSSSNTTVATVVSTTGVVTGNVAGTTIITGTGTNGCTRTAIVTVNPLPSAITGTMIVCAGQQVTLSSSPATGGWTSGTTSMATVNFSTGVVTGTNAGATQGTSVITYTLLTTCFRTAIVTVNPQPSAITPTNPAVCIGLTTTLASTPLTGTWSSSNSTIAPVGAGTGIVTGIAPGGTATITYTLPTTACYRTKQITVNPLPAAISGATSLCPATNITLSDATGGGTWSSSNTFTATINTSTGDVAGLNTGTTIITYTLPTGCVTTLIVTVVTAPTAVITALGDTSLCPGGFATLAASTTPGVTYDWLNGGTSIGVTTPTYIATTGGSYQVRVSLAGGCSAISVPMAVSIVPATAVITLMSGSSSGCGTTGVTMAATAGTGLNYQWLLGSAPIAGATGATYTAMASGFYSVVISNSTGCSATSALQEVTVNPVPGGVVTASGSLAICTGTHVTLTADGGPGYTYQWYDASGPIAGATNMSFVASTTGSYYFTETTIAGCTATSATSNVVENPLPDATVTHFTGSTIFCTGGAVALDALPGNNYQWYRNGIAVSGATNATYVASTSGSYKVMVTDPATTCSATTPTNTVVTVVGSPIVLPLSPAKFCWGGSSLLSTSVSSVGSAVNYQWLFNGSPISGATNSTYEATVAGDYSCNITVPASCFTTTSTIAVTENPLPDPLVSYDGTMFHTGTYFVSFQWYKGLVLIPGATAATTPATGNGNYKVAVTDTNGCQSVSTFYVLTTYHGPATGVTTLNTTDVRIYPNPARNTVHIESAVPVNAVITGIDGRELLTVTAASDIDVSSLTNGVYMIMIYDTDHHMLKTEKLVKAGE